MFLIRPNAVLQGQSYVVQAAYNKSFAPLVMYQFPQSLLSFYLSPILDRSCFALVAINLESQLIFFLKEELTYWKRILELVQSVTMQELRLIGYLKFIEINWFYLINNDNNQSCIITKSMNNASSSSTNQSSLNKSNNFLSEYDSYESESYSHRLKNLKSSKIMKKLKELWNRQKYLTDDEMESCKDQIGSCSFDQSAMQEEPKYARTKRRQQSEVLLKKQSQTRQRKRFHARQQSEQEEDNINMIRKKRGKEIELVRKDSRDMQQLQQIAAFNSQVENQSR